MNNAHGLDADYFIRLFQRELNPDVVRNQNPDDLARVLLRAARTASEKVFSEPEFRLGKYAEVLRPFLKMMETELHANAHKGDRAGWLQMDVKTALLEIHYHLAKLQTAAIKGDVLGIVEYAADTANMAMMLVDICGLLTRPDGHRIYTTNPGESVMGIANRELGGTDRWQEIVELNADRFPVMGPHGYYPPGTNLTLPPRA